MEILMLQRCRAAGTQRARWTRASALPAGMLLALLAPAGAQQIGGGSPLTSGNTAITGAAMPTTSSVPGMPDLPGSGAQQPRHGSNANDMPYVEGEATAADVVNDCADAVDSVACNAARKREGRAPDPFGRKAASRNGKTQATEKNDATADEKGVQQVSRGGYTEFQKY